MAHLLQSGAMSACVGPGGAVPPLVLVGLEVDADVLVALVLVLPRLVLAAVLLLEVDVEAGGLGVTGVTDVPLTGNRLRLIQHWSVQCTCYIGLSLE